MALPAIVAGAAGLFGAYRSNRVNQREAQRNRDFQSAEAKRQMGFQEQMRNTSWQASVADMQAAGLNPALAYSQGPAGMPFGAAGSGAQAAGAENVSSSAMQALHMRKSLQLLDQQVKHAGAQARSAESQANLDGRREDYLLRSFGVGGHTSIPPFNLMLEAELSNALAGAQNLQAIQERNRNLARISGPMADLSDDLGRLLPIFGGLIGAAGPAGNFIRALRRRGR